MKNLNLKQPNPEKVGFGKRFISLLTNLKSNEKVVIWFTFLTGACLFLSGIILQENHPDMAYAIKAFATIITIESIASTISLSLLHQTYLDDMSAEMDKKLIQFSEDLLLKFNAILARHSEEILAHVSQYLIDIKNVSSLGVINLYKLLDLKKILEVQKTSSGGILIFQRLFFPDAELKLLAEYLPRLIIKCNKTFQIIFVSPIEANNSSQIKIATNIQLAEFNKLKKALPEEKRENLQIKFYETSVIASFTGYADKLIYRSYLSNRILDEGIFIETKGKNTELYKDWYSYFRSNWDNATQYPNVENDLVKPDKQGQNSKVGRIKTLAECLNR